MHLVHFVLLSVLVAFASGSSVDLHQGEPSSNLNVLKEKNVHSRDETTPEESVSKRSKKDEPTFDYGVFGDCQEPETVSSQLSNWLTDIEKHHDEVLGHYMQRHHKKQAAVDQSLYCLKQMKFSFLPNLYKLIQKAWHTLDADSLDYLLYVLPHKEHRLYSLEKQLEKFTEVSLPVRSHLSHNPSRSLSVDFRHYVTAAKRRLDLMKSLEPPSDNQEKRDLLNYLIDLQKSDLLYFDNMFGVVVDLTALLAGKPNVPSAEHRELVEEFTKPIAWDKSVVAEYKFSGLKVDAEKTVFHAGTYRAMAMMIPGVFRSLHDLIASVKPSCPESARQILTLMQALRNHPLILQIVDSYRRGQEKPIEYAVLSASRLLKD